MTLGRWIKFYVVFSLFLLSFLRDFGSRNHSRTMFVERIKYLF
jgi:hypothetical protein